MIFKTLIGDGISYRARINDGNTHQADASRRQCEMSIK